MPWDDQLLKCNEDIALGDVPAHLRRGIAVAPLFAQFGRILRLRPDSLPMEEQEVLHHKSSPISEVSFFISHCWASSGFEKYLALLVHFLGGPSLLAGLLATCGCYATTVYVVELPSFGTKYEALWDVTFPVYHWEYYAGLLAGFGALLFGGKLRRGKAGFLDCACIHQTDPTQKAEGIRVLPSYVKSSREFVVLWDELYFTRMWCTYELGIFVASNPEAPISVLPLRMTSSLIKMNLYHVAAGAAFLFLWPVIPGTTGFLLAAASAMFPLLCFIGREAAVFVEQALQLEARLGDFNASQAECSVPSDKEVLVKDLEKRFEDRGGIPAFNSWVRSTIKRRVLSELINSRTILSHRSIFIAQCPVIPFLICGQRPYNGMAPLAQLCRAVWAFTHAFAVFPWSLALVATLASRPVLESGGKAAPSHKHLLLCSAVGTLIITAFNALGYLFPVGLALGAFPAWSTSPWHGLVLEIMVDTLFALPALWFFFCRPSEPRLREHEIQRGRNGLRDKSE